MTQQATKQTHETIRLSVDGDQHCALLGEDLAIGVAGFGRTMAEALRDLAGALDPLEQAALLIDGSCCVACGRSAHLSQSRVNDVAVVDVQPGCKCGAPLRVWSTERVMELLEEEAKASARPDAGEARVDDEWQRKTAAYLRNQTAVPPSFVMADAEHQVMWDETRLTATALSLPVVVPLDHVRAVEKLALSRSRPDAGEAARLREAREAGFQEGLAVAQRICEARSDSLAKHDCNYTASNEAHKCASAIRVFWPEHRAALATVPRSPGEPTTEQLTPEAIHRLRRNDPLIAAAYHAGREDASAENERLRKALHDLARALDGAERPLNALAMEISAINRANGWSVPQPEDWESDYKIPALLALVHSEASESLEGFRHGDRENVGEELGDVLIRTLDLLGGLGYDADAIVTAKLEKNRRRGIRHGGKRV